MELFTIQLAQWRVAKRLAIPLIDTTVKSGESTFSPTWDLVLNIKSGKITESEYTEGYFNLMRQSYTENPTRWLEVLGMECVAVACYCPVKCFCHRLLLVEIFEKLCLRHKIPFTYSGELSHDTRR